MTVQRYEYSLSRR